MYTDIADINTSPLDMTTMADCSTSARGGGEDGGGVCGGDGGGGNGGGDGGGGDGGGNGGGGNGGGGDGARTAWTLTLTIERVICVFNLCERPLENAGEFRMSSTSVGLTGANRGSSVITTRKVRVVPAISVTTTLALPLIVRHASAITSEYGCCSSFRERLVTAHTTSKSTRVI